MIIGPHGLLLLVVLAAVMVIDPAIAHLNGMIVGTGGGPGPRMAETGGIEAQVLGEEATMLNQIISHVAAGIHLRCKLSLLMMWTGKSRCLRLRCSPDFDFSRNYVYHVEKAYKAEGVRTDALIVNARTPMLPAVQRFIDDGAAMVVTITRNQPYANTVNVALPDPVPGSSKVGVKGEFDAPG